MLNSLIGMSVMSLVLTYVMQIFNALRTRNTLGLAIQTLSDDTGDAAELIAGLGPHRQFNSGFTTLSSLAFAASEIKESHHFYPCCSTSGFPSRTTRCRRPRRCCSTLSRC